MWYFLVCFVVTENIFFPLNLTFLQTVKIQSKGPLSGLNLHGRNHISKLQRSAQSKRSPL